MVATSLPFWMPNPSRTMSRGSYDFGTRAEPLEPGLGARQAVPARHRSDDGLVVEACEADAMARHLADWSALVGRALEPNVFLEPGFALPAAQHFALAQRPTFVLVWDEAGPVPVLLGLCALLLERRGFGPRVVTAWGHEQAPLGAPLLDRNRAESVLAALLGWLPTRWPDQVGLLITGLDEGGPLMGLLGHDQRHVAVLDRRSRAVLPGLTDRTAPAALAPKQAKELRRQSRRLADGGALRFRSARTADEVRHATEQFLELEARGWKGARGTALLGDPALATFTRTMTRTLAREGKCAIHSLDVDGRPVAMGIVLRSGERAYFWKTCYDESRSALSPGKQLAQCLTELLSAEDGVAITDSCAMPDHPMIDRLWRDRATVADLLVAGADAPADRFAQAVRHIRVWRGCRATAKLAVVAGRRLLARARGR